MRKFIIVILIFCFNVIGIAQLQYYSEKAMDGYTLFLGDRLYLVNNCGEEVHSWFPVVPIYHVKLLPNGNILFINWQDNAVEERDWDDNLVKSIKPSDPHITLEYEVIALDNGNYLCVGRKEMTSEELLNIGYNLSEIGSPPHVDVVVEMDGENGNIVWQWTITNHVIQQRSTNLPNYGIVSDHPELLNLDAISTNDWVNEEAFMINGMDYNPTLDQIVLSLRKMSEIVIIDHSTTTEEAASHTGGMYGKGGDILYRWGNPQNYNRGDVDDQELYFQHNPNWIQYREHIDKIAIFNNGIYRPGVTFENQYSNAPIIATPIRENGSYEIVNNLPFGPELATVDYGIPGATNHFFSYYTSATKVLPNGNVLITVGGDHTVIELEPDGTLVWEYVLASAFFTFRAEKYSVDYPAFAGRDLTPSATIEDPPSAVPCNLVSTNDNVENISFRAWSDANNIYFQSPMDSDFTIEVFNLFGQRLTYFDSKSQISEEKLGHYSFPRNQNKFGLIFLTLTDKNSNQLVTSKLLLR